MSRNEGAETDERVRTGVPIQAVNPSPQPLYALVPTRVPKLAQEVLRNSTRKTNLIIYVMPERQSKLLQLARCVYRVEPKHGKPVSE